MLPAVTIPEKFRSSFHLVSVTHEIDNNTISVLVSARLKLTPSSRGQLLLDLEDMLCQQIDPRIRIWHTPLGDKNSLRNLRGITLNSPLNS